MEKLNRFNHWQKVVYDFFQLSHPYLFEDEEAVANLIITLGEQGYEEFSDLLGNGMPYDQAHEIARQHILDQYCFSPTDWLSSFMFEKNNWDYEAEEIVDLYITLEPTFEMLGITSSTKLEESPKLEKQLRQEVKAYTDTLPKITVNKKNRLNHLNYKYEL